MIENYSAAIDILSKLVAQHPDNVGVRARLEQVRALQNVANNTRIVLLFEHAADEMFFIRSDVPQFGGSKPVKMASCYCDFNFQSR